jgi:uncharacterized DUF497 family protein
LACRKETRPRWKTTRGVADFSRLRFEWDDDKADRNLRAHGISFDEAQSVFADPLNAVGPDRSHSIGEERFVMLGESESGRLLVVVHSIRPTAIRIISARLANRRERTDYEHSSP